MSVYIFPELLTEIIKTSVNYKIRGVLYGLVCACKTTADYFRNNLETICNELTEKYEDSGEAFYHTLPNGFLHGEESRSWREKCNWHIGVKHGIESKHFGSFGRTVWKIRNYHYGELDGIHVRVEGYDNEIYTITLSIYNKNKVSFIVEFYYRSEWGVKEVIDGKEREYNKELIKSLSLPRNYRFCYGEWKGLFEKYLYSGPLLI